MSGGDMLTGEVFKKKFVIVVKGGENLPRRENVAINVKGGEC